MDLDLDPFGLRSRVTNSALSKQQTVAPDIYEQLFDKTFFQTEKFRYWSQGDRPWQLHCYGAPGCGKTTLAAIAVQRLRTSQPGKITVPVASLFLERDVSQDAAAFLEDFLCCIHQQIPSAGFESDRHFDQYEEACQCGESILKRVGLLRIALYSRLDDNDYTFLVFDGYDRLSEGLQLLLDRELVDLQDHRLRVLQTRRVPAFELPIEMNCDGIRDGDQCENYDLKLYWLCKKCYKDPVDCYALCYDCKKKRVKCPVHGAAYLEESYDHVDINISLPDDMDEYVAWDLKRVYGDNKSHQIKENGSLGTSSEMHKADVEITSTLSATGERRRKVIETISKVGNITLVKLYLDNIHKHQTFDVVEKVGDRQARNLIAFFDAGIERIKQQPKHQSDVALMAIAAAAEKERGIPLIQLEEWMRDALSRLSHIASAPPRSLEDILRFANGFITAAYSGDRRVSTYNPLFALYVRENYNNTLFWAKSQLNIHRVSRSSTFQPQLTSPPLVASPPTMDSEFEAQREGIGKPLHGWSLGPYDHSTDSNEFPFPPKKSSFVGPLPVRDDSEPAIKMFGRSSRISTMLPSTSVRKVDFRSDMFEIQEEPTSILRDQPRSKSSTNQQSSRLCIFCETSIFGSGKLSGTYQREYSQLQLPIAKRCIFCCTLYKSYLSMSKDDRDNLRDADSPTTWWTIRSTARSRESNNSIVISFHVSGHQTTHNKEPGHGAFAVGFPNYGDDPSSQARPITYRFHLLSEDNLGHIPTKHDLGLTTDPFGKSGNQVKNWIENCTRNHPNCRRKVETTWVPTRLLDLQFGDLSSVRLVKTAEEHTSGPYVTLSHCWGPQTAENSFLTTQGEYEELYKKNGIKVTALSVNFQQAISVARFLGVRYIWIDSLCIIQGPLSDFKSEGQLMHKVYRYSYCNFAAADSEDSRGGLFRSRNPADILPGRFQGDGSSAMFGTATWRIVPENLWETELLNSSIYTRGWVFQERMLTPRILHFTNKQIFWDCSTISACETIPNGLPLPLDDAASTDRHWRGRLQESSSLAHAPLSGANDDSLEDFWSSSVLRYTRCNLTNQSDKSVAIWSIAKLVRDAADDQYGAGHWGYRLEEQLSWKVIDIKKSSRSIELQWKQPSWSWTSVQGAISLAERAAVKRCYVIKGHKDEAITFKTKGFIRPHMEREHSDSFKEDLEIGWGAWQKKTRMQSLPQVTRRDIKEERSRSMPVVQKQMEKPAERPLVLKDANRQIWPRDMEPELESKSIAIHAPIGSGTLRQNTANGTYTFEIDRKTEAPTTVSDSTITLAAFPDTEPSTDATLVPNSFHFVILTATSHTAPTTNALGIAYPHDSDNDPDPILTYSGSGLLLLHYEEYVRRGELRSKLTVAEKALEVRLATGGGEAWVVNRMVEELEALAGLVLSCEQYKGAGEEGRHYRRVGVVEFEGLSEEVYESIMGREKDRERVWID